MAQQDLTEWDKDLTTSVEEEYAALLRAIRWAKGFGLLFVQCSPAEGERLIQQTREDVAQKTVAVLELNDAVEDLRETVAAYPAIEKTQVLFVRGLEQSLVPYIKPGYGSEGDYYAQDTVPKLLGKLNLQRERFKEDFPLCFVFLVPRYAMKYLIRRAADFFDWRSGVWEFVLPQEEQQQESQRLLQEGDYEKYLSWTSQQRRQRVLEIDDLLANPDILAPEASALYFEQGNLLAANQDFEAAIAAYDAASVIKPDIHKAFNNKGNALSNLGRYEAAIAAYDAALALKPDKHEALYNKGNALKELDRYEAAIAAYDAALAIKPDKHEALNNKGWVLDKSRRHKAAIAAYDAALAIKPNDHEVLYNKGNVLSNLGRYEAAITVYDAALAIKPDYQLALENRELAIERLAQQRSGFRKLKVTISRFWKSLRH